MPGPHPAVAATRRAVREALAARDARAARGALTDGADGAHRADRDDVAPAELVLVACSGGPDSLALAAAAAFEVPRAGLRVGAVVVDHGLQPGSARVAADAGAACRSLGLAPVDVVRVDGEQGPALGPEGKARKARYDALGSAAQQRGAVAVWLGHTLDDQAEQVLLGLCRGSGTRSLSGMPRARGPYVRPFLALGRAITRAACDAQGLRPWKDPTNDDPAYLRNRVRRALADLDADLGPGLAPALARSARLARQDADALDDLTARVRAQLGPAPWPAQAMAAQPAAIRGRLWRRLAEEAGAGALTSAHVAALDAFVEDWRGQGPVHLPGGALGSRAADRVGIARSLRGE